MSNSRKERKREKKKKKPKQERYRTEIRASRANGLKAWALGLCGLLEFVERNSSEMRAPGP